MYIACYKATDLHRDEGRDLYMMRWFNGAIGRRLGVADIGTLSLVLIAILVVVVFQPYYFGYRLSRDDVWFLKVGTEGFLSIRDHAILVATEQGRIGQVLMLPLNVFGSLLAGNPLWRGIFIALYVIQLLLFSVFVARVLRRDVAPFLFLLLVVLHPLVFDNMPPNAYPLQNTVPFIAVLISRLVILVERQRGAPSRARIALMEALFVLGMFISEFAVAFGTALLIAEYLARIQWGREAGNSWGVALRASFVPRFLLSDGLAILVALVPYGLFRWWYPSIYAGNSVGDIHKFGRVFGTAFWHIVEGTPARFLSGGLPSAGNAELLPAVIVGAAVAFCLYRLAGPVLRIRAPWSVAAVAFLLAIYVNLPIAITVKYQQECMDWGKCGYLDSRVSYLLVVITVMCVFSIVGRLPIRRIALGVSSILLGIAAMFVSLHNINKAKEMRQFDAVWMRANAVACVIPELVQDEAGFVATVDPQGLVEMHPPSKPIEFWRAYIPWQSGLPCRSGI